MPALGDDYFVTFSMRDETGELGNFSVGVPAINAASITSVLANVTDFQTALGGITLGVIAAKHWGDKDTESNALPGDNAAQRENKLLVKYRDDTTEQDRIVTIPTVDFDQLVFMPGAGDKVAFSAANGASAAMQAFVTAFETLVVARDTGNTVTIVEMRYVGRNS